MRPSSCELTPATVCWTRWNPDTPNSSGTESCREITVFHVASWSGVPGQPPPPPPGHDWAAAFILTRWSRGLTVAYPPSRLPPAPPPALPPPSTKLLQAPFYKPHGRSHVLHFIQVPPVRAVMLIVPPWQHVARWMQLSGFWGRDSSSGRDRWRRTMMVMSEYCRESKKKNPKKQGGGTWLTGKQEAEKWFRQVRDGLRGREWLFLSLTRSKRFLFQIKKNRSVIISKSHIKSTAFIAILHLKTDK